MDLSLINITNIQAIWISPSSVLSPRLEKPEITKRGRQAPFLTLNKDQSNGAITRLTIAMTLIRMFIDGPEVSLKGSPTVSPTTAAA